MKTRSFLLAAGIVLAMVFTLSCSGDDGNEGDSSSSVGGNRKGSREITEVYALKAITDNSFTFTYIDTISGTDYCGAFGVLKRKADVHDETINYSISNNILVWQGDYADSLHFIGTSNNLIGAWTREVKKYGQFQNIAKAEFMENELRITYDYCASDRMLLRYGEDRGNGWKIRNVNCETYEMYKGNEVITVKETSRLDVISSLSITYKGKTCKTPTISQHEQACSDAWNRLLQVTDITELAVELLEIYLEEYFYKEQIEEEFAECLVNTIPYTEIQHRGYKNFLWGF